MAPIIFASITYDPGEVSAGAATEIIIDGERLLYKSINNDKHLNFLPIQNYGLLPPVTKYISPSGGDYDIVLIEVKPQMMKFILEDGMVPIPWSYFLIKLNRVKGELESFSVCWLFRDEQLYMADEPLGSSWLSRRSFDECHCNIEKYMEANCFYTGMINGQTRNLHQICMEHLTNTLWHRDAFGINIYARRYGILPDEFMESLSHKPISFVIEAGAEQEFSVNTLHKAVVSSASKNVPYLSEKIINESTTGYQHL